MRRSYIINVKIDKLQQLWHATHATSFLQTIRRGTPIRLKTTQPALPPNHHQSHAMVPLTSSVAGEALVTLTGCGGCFGAGERMTWMISLWDHRSEFHGFFCTKSGPVFFLNTLWQFQLQHFGFGIQTPPNSLGELRVLC